MIIWPGNRIDGRMTINGARGFLHKISDRFDLTLECVRRHYLGTPSPLGEVFARYGNFFALFDDFCGYVDFFLLQDLVTTDYKAVKFLLPFDDFKTPAVPQDVESFASYRQRSMDFIHAGTGGSRGGPTGSPAGPVRECRAIGAPPEAASGPA